jgi:amidase
MNKLLQYLVCIFIISGWVGCQNNPERIDSQKQSFPYEEMTIAEMQQGYQKGDFTVEEVVQAYLNRIEAIDKNGPTLNSVIQGNPDALQIAKQMDAELKAGNPIGPLFGIPVLLKDNIDTHDKMETTAGSRALLGSHPIKDSWVTKKLRESGAVIIGKTNLSEWANFRGNLSISGWSGLGGQTKNPYILDRNPCGSSSGSGVAVSANLCMIAIGTETNGSIVCPAHANGIVGIKPTVGLISRSGIIPISSTQDTPGPMARSVADAAACLGALTGIDSTDIKTKNSTEKSYTNYTQFLNEKGLEGKRIGWYKPSSGIHFKVDALMNRAIEYIRNQGAEVIELDAISLENVENHSFEVMLFEYKAGLNAYFASLGAQSPIKNLDDLIAFNEKDSIELRYFDQAFLKMANQKDDLNSKEYLEALARMQKGMQQDGMDRVMDAHKLDAIIAPTGAPAWKTDAVNGDFFMLGSSSPAAISGYPSITIPMGFIDELPVGISFFGRAWSEPVLIEMAYSYEQGTKYRKAPKFLIN